MDASRKGRVSAENRSSREHTQSIRQGLFFRVPPSTNFGWNPGFGGQSFIPATLDKLREVRKIIDASGRDIRLEVDGGVKVVKIMVSICTSEWSDLAILSAIFKLSKLFRRAESDHQIS